MTAARERLEERLRQLVGIAARRVGLAVVRDDFNSPIVRPDRLEPAVWSRPAPMPGLRLDLDAQLQLLEGRLAPLIAEWNPPIAGPPPDGGFYMDNQMYGPLDSHVCYALLRDRPPARVLELGSGYSTLVISAALCANAAKGHAAEHLVIDPAPSPLLARAPGPLRARAESAAATDRELFCSLQAGDVLFVDTSHSVRPGGEVVRLVPRRCCRSWPPGCSCTSTTSIAPSPTRAFSMRHSTCTGRSSTWCRRCCARTPASRCCAPTTHCGGCAASASSRCSLA